MDYLLKSMLCLLALLFIHRLLLQREVLHRFNRFFLLASVLGSFFIPLYTMEVPVQKTESIAFEAVSTEENGDFEHERFSAVAEAEIPEAVVGDESAAARVATTSFPWEKALWVAYFIISAVFLLRFLRNFGRLLHQIRTSPHLAYRGETLVLNPDHRSPFSFLKYIFVSRRSFEQDGISDAVFAHERCHVREKHSWDILLVEALLVPFWFHPGLHLAKQAIKLNHEFIADQAALSTTSIQDYQQQLLNILLDGPTQRMVSSLNFSLTKKRMEMMKKDGKNPFRWLKILVLVPLIAGIAYLFSDKVMTQVETQEESDLVSASESHLKMTKINLNADGTIEIDGRLIEKDQLIEAIDGLKGEVDQVEFSAEPGVKIGALADVQEMLRKNEIRRVSYQQADDEKGSSLSEEGASYYRNATFFVENKKGEFIRKDFEELSSNEKSYLISPPKAPSLKSPSPEILDLWKNSKEYTLWLDGQAVSNDQLEDLDASDIVFYFSSYFPSSQRTANYPQAYKIRMFTADGYESTFGAKSGFASPLVEDDMFHIYPLTKRVNYAMTVVKNGQSPIDMYLRLYDSYSSEFDGKGDDELSEWKQALGWQLFTELGGRYYRLSAANKKLVPRANRPEFQYWVPLKKDGIRYYKKQNELTEEEKSQLPPPPPPPAQRDNLTDEKELHYRSAVFLIESEDMVYTRKTYLQLTEEQKKDLFGPMKARQKERPDPTLFESWKDNKIFAIWIDGVVTPNEKLNDYTAADFAGFFQSGVEANARSERFPQPYQVHLYSDAYYDKEFGPNSARLQPRTSGDTITLTSRRVIYFKDISKYPDPNTAYLQKNARYEKLRTSGTIYPQKSAQEKALLDSLYIELNNEYSQSSDKRKKSLKQPISPDSDTPRNGNATQNNDEKIAVQNKGSLGGKELVYEFASSNGGRSARLQEYLAIYGKYQTVTYENRLFEQPVVWGVLHQQKMFKQLEAKYNGLSFEERRQVKRATFPYVKMESGGKEVFVKIEDLTPQQRRELGC